MTTIYSKAGTDAAISGAVAAIAAPDLSGLAPVDHGHDGLDVDQIALAGNLALTVPAGYPAGQVYRVVFTQDGTGGHTVTYGGQPLTVDTTAGASTLVEVWPGGRVVIPGSGGAVDTVNGHDGAVVLSAADVGAAASTDLGLAFGIDSATESVSPTIGVIGSIAGVAYGQRTDGVAGIHRSTDDGATWQQVSTQRAFAIVSTGDGEVIANGGGILRKSSGWATNPTTATWTDVADANGGGNFIASDLDAYDNIVIAAEYAIPRNDARYVKVSTDHGATFTNVLDLDVLYPGQSAATHWHAVCIDPWHDGPNPRLWASHGDGPRGAYYSDDLGATWTLYTAAWQPMPMIATPNGIVTSTDAADPDGVWLIPRTLGPKVLLHSIREPYWQGALLGFGVSAARDPRDPSRVVILFRADQQTYFTKGNPARIFVSDGYRASEAYTTANTESVGVTGSTSWEGPPAITSTGKVLATYTASGVRWTVAGQLKLIAPTRQVADPGNVLTGRVVGRSSIAIGSRVTAANRSVVIGTSAGQTFAPATDWNSVAVGEEASIRGHSAAVGFQANAAALSTAVGNLASATGGESVAIGSSSSAVGQYSAVVGKSASAAELGGVAVGKATAGGAAGVAVGYNATAAGYSAIAIGSGASAAGSEAIAIGRQANASHASSVAVTGVATTGISQVALGARHIEMTELAATPVTVGVNQARLFLKDNGAGKTQLCIIFNTGSSQVIATEL